MKKLMLVAMAGIILGQTISLPVLNAQKVQNLKIDIKEE